MKQLINKWWFWVIILIAFIFVLVTIFPSTCEQKITEVQYNNLRDAYMQLCKSTNAGINLNNAKSNLLKLYDKGNYLIFQEFDCQELYKLNTQQ